MAFHKQSYLWEKKHYTDQCDCISLFTNKGHVFVDVDAIGHLVSA